jgi:AraC-like DNA-binding protein
MNLIQLELLHWCHDQNEVIRQLTIHDHPHWQLEFCVKGSIATYDIQKTLLLQPGMFFLVPPQSSHGFLKPHPNTESYSFKFKIDNDIHWSGANIRWISPDDFTRWLGRVLLELIADETQGSLIVNHKQDALEYLLLSMVHYVYRGFQKGTALPEPITQLREMVLSEGRKINVEMAATRLGCTVSSLKYSFARAAKQCLELNGDTSVKRYLDRVCLELVENHLEYSSFSIGRIAETTGFPDIYALSRFYTRMRGFPPSHFKPSG